jgi:chromosome segregation ATPase
MVSVESLQQVKSALLDFKTEIEGLFVDVDSKVEDILQECSSYVAKLESDIRDQEALVKNISEEVLFLEDSIRNLFCTSNGLKMKLENLYSKIDDISTQRADFQKKLSVLNDQYHLERDFEEKLQLEQKITSLENKLEVSNINYTDVRNEIENIKKQRMDIDLTLDKSKSKKFNLEVKLSDQKRILKNLQLKLSKLKRILEELRSTSIFYINTVKKVKYFSDDVTQKNLNAVGKCIRYIDEYLSVSL